LPLFSGDLGRLILACAEGDMNDCGGGGSSGCALCLVLASGGYPGEFKKGLRISGLGTDASRAPSSTNKSGSRLYHAGTAFGHDGGIITSGGRVISVVGVGGSFGEARRMAYERASGISFDGVHYRKDIGWSEG
jgi:phosphoribosylamine--glycine ligase